MKDAKTIVVIGGSSGYGRGIVEEFFKNGWNVFVLSRENRFEDLPKSEVKGNGCFWVKCDVTSFISKRTYHFEAAIESLEGAYMQVRQYDMPIHAVVYSAGIAIDKNTIEEGDRDNWNAVFQTNTLGLMDALKMFTVDLIETQGHFIHIGSIANKLNYAGGSDYCASKAASSSIMRAFREENKGTGIHSTSIEIGLGNTNFQKNRYDGDMEKAKKHYKGIRQLEPNWLGEYVHQIVNQPFFVNIGEIVVTPLEQISHGNMAKVMQDKSE